MNARLRQLVLRGRLSGFLQTSHIYLRRWTPTQNPKSEIRNPKSTCTLFRPRPVERNLSCVVRRATQYENGLEDFLTGWTTLNDTFRSIRRASCVMRLAQTQLRNTHYAIRTTHIIIAVCVFLGLCVVAVGAVREPPLQRFLPPEFESGYVRPSPTTPSPRQDIYEYVDAAVLLAAIGLSSYLVAKKRNRRAIFSLMVFSLLYFGFWRKGCVCSVGAIQNITLAVFDRDYAVPVVVVIFFFLPLASTLLFGRTFCAAVCPLGAIQDLLIIPAFGGLLRPVSVPNWLESTLRLFAYVYLGAAVLFAATGSAFLICRYDPFVSFFHLSGNLNILILGACLLLIGLFIGRPYCRFVCPYGVILRQLSRISRWHVTITPGPRGSGDCVQCKLCEDSCPFGAIREPTVDWPAQDYRRSKKRLAFLILLVPVLVLLGGWVGYSLRMVTSCMHPTVRLAERIYLEDSGGIKPAFGGAGTTDASLAFRATGKEAKELYQEASNIRARFGRGGWLLGGFVGLVIALKLIGVSVWRQRTDYEADRASCLACGRCFQYCPKERVRLKKAKDQIGKS